MNTYVSLNADSAPSPLRFRRYHKAFVSTYVSERRLCPSSVTHWNKQGKEELTVTPTVPPLQPTQKGTQTRTSRVPSSPGP